MNECGDKVTNSVQAASGDPSPVQEETAAVNERYKELQGNLKERQGELEKALARGSQLQDTLDGIKMWTADNLEAFDLLDPVSTDPDTAKKQLDDAQVRRSL